MEKGPTDSGRAGAEAQGLPETDGLTWHPLTPDLVPAWHALYATIVDADDEVEHLSAEDLADELEPEWVNPATDGRIAVDAAGTARAFTLLDLRPDQLTLLKPLLWGGVHPDWRARGIGRALLAWQCWRAVGWVAARRAELGPVPASGMVQVPQAAAATERLLARTGFAPSRYFFAMRRDLADPVPEVAVPVGLRLVPFGPGLDEPVRLAHNEAFAEQWAFQPFAADTWKQWMTGHRDFRPDWSIVLLDGEQVAGYVLNSGFTADWEATGEREGWTPLVGVRPAWRGRGLARALLAASMRAFAADGMQFAGLDVDSENPTGALGLYTSLGYAVRHRSARWTIPL